MPKPDQAEVDATITIVARTLEEVAFHIPSGEGRDNLLEIASTVRKSNTPEILGGGTCPVCQEDPCDPPSGGEPCPMYDIRTALQS